MDESRRAKPIFFDAERRRWPLVRNAFLAIGVVIAVLMAALIARVLVAPVLPALGLVPGAGAGTAAAAAEHRQVRPLTGRTGAAAPAPVAPTIAAAATTAPAAADLPARFAYFVNWDEMAMASLKENLASLDGLFPEWLHLTSADGSLSEDEPRIRDRVLDLVHRDRPQLRIMPLVNNWGEDGLAVAPVVACLRDADATRRVVQRLAAYAEDLGAAGLCVDFSGIPADATDAYLAFLGRLGERLRADRRALAVVAPAADAGFPYAGCAAACDLVVVTLFDEHGAGAAAGPIASRAWFATTLRARLAAIPADKLVPALGAFAYDRAAGAPTGRLGFEQAMLAARAHDAAVAYDPASLNPSFAYADDAGRDHRVWLLDGVTACDQLAAAGAAGVRRAALWRLGCEDASLWPAFARDGAAGAAAAAALRSCGFHYRVDYQGAGEVVAVTASPEAGEREVGYDAATGLMAPSRYARLPRPYQVTRYGAVGRSVALTFDDGPDSEWTPKVLDLLRAKGVQATFFLIGGNARTCPDLVRRLVAEGHEIGNHTYTHPLLSKIGETQVRVELTATERVIESLAESRTVLFRQPYAEDVEARTMAEVERLRVIDELGYLTVGAGVDSEDWRRPGVAQIAKNVFDGLERGDGRIVLMHDAGGDRDQTLAALPLVIDGLRERGYDIVPMSTLLGRGHDRVMPPLSGNDLSLARVSGLGIGLAGWFGAALNALFVIGTALGIGRLACICVLAVIERRRWRAPAEAQRLPRVAVLIPAYNEEKVITQTVDSLLASTYAGQLEIIVVDDGSKDKTHERVSTRYLRNHRVRSFTKTNGGKPDALNFAMDKTDAEILVALDADTVFLPDTVAKLVRHFADPTVGAVAGNAKVGNRVNVLTKWQALEYVTSQNLDRRAFHLLNCITVVPGAVGAWRRDVVQAIGGFTADTLAEDADLTLAILRRGYRVAYEDQAIALTEAPETVGAFLKQRYRWMFGTAQAAWKHRQCLLRPRFKALGLIALPNIVLFQILFPLIAPVVDLALVCSLFRAAVGAWQVTAVGAEPAHRILLYWLLFSAVDLVAALIAFRYEPGEDKRLLWWLLPQRFFYRQLLYYVAIKATLSALRGREVGWGKLERTASVRLPAVGATPAPAAEHPALVPITDAIRA